MEEKDKKSEKKSIWTIIKESMNKASSGCGPGCGCHVDDQDRKKQQKDTPDEQARTRRDGSN